MPRMCISLLTQLALVLSACSDPQCASTELKVGSVCRPRPPSLGEDAGDTEIDFDDTTGRAAPGAGEGGGYVGGLDGSAPDAVAGSAMQDSGISAIEAGTDGESSAPAQCYLDRDGDGTGAGAPVDCAAALIASMSDAGAPKPVLTHDDCDDTDPARSPSLTDVCGDAIDNDCDGRADSERNNACGGPCTTQLNHQPGEPCTNGLLGACARSGVYACQPDGTIACNAPSVTSTPEICDDIDNDCDGQTDDGLFNECGGQCGDVLPNKPGAPCSNGQLGACARAGVYVCQGTGTVCDAPEMLPGKENCADTGRDGIDNDCNGDVDEHCNTDFGCGFLLLRPNAECYSRPSS